MDKFLQLFLKKSLEEFLDLFLEECEKFLGDFWRDVVSEKSKKEFLENIRVRVSEGISRIMNKDSLQGIRGKCWL